MPPFSSQKAPSAKRCIKTKVWTPSGNVTVAVCVRKHRAPKGALRPRPRRGHGHCPRRVRKHRAPESFACNSFSSNFNERRIPRHLNGAASSLEGVEAELHATFSSNPPRSAPKGALRLLLKISVALTQMLVRKHQAPKGALRLAVGDAPVAVGGVCQKAPSAKRCIKTRTRECGEDRSCSG